MALSYMSVRGKEFPLWFVILVAVLVVGAAVCAFVFTYLENRKQSSKTTREEPETTGYMGKDRLLKILTHYVLGRYGEDEEMYDHFISTLKECNEQEFYIEQKRRAGAFYSYTQTNGFPARNEWLKCVCLGHDFLIEVCGEKSKRVTITDFRGNFSGNGQPSKCDYFYTFYDENYVPKPNETLLRGDTVRGDRAPTSVFNAVKPFTDEHTIHNGINRDICVCYGIDKEQ